MNEEKFSEKDGKTDTKYFNVALCTIAGLVTSYATCGLVPGSGFLVTGANVGIQTATTTYVNTFLSSGGSPRAAYESVFSESGLKNIGISALSASILHQLNISSASGPDLNFWDRFNSRFQTHALNGSFNVLFRDADLLDTCQSVLFNSFADAVDIHLATEIGKQKGTIDPLAHKLAHGFTGGLTGCIKGMVKGDIGHAALSGVVAGVSSECFAELYSWASGRDEQIKDLGKEANAEAVEIASEYVILSTETDAEIKVVQDEFSQAATAALSEINEREVSGEVLDETQRNAILQEKLRAMKGYDIHHEFFEKASINNLESFGESINYDLRHDVLHCKFRETKSYASHREFFDSASAIGKDYVGLAIDFDLYEHIFHKKYLSTDVGTSFSKMSAKCFSILLAGLCKLDIEITENVSETALEHNFAAAVLRSIPKRVVGAALSVAAWGSVAVDFYDAVYTYHNHPGSAEDAAIASLKLLSDRYGGPEGIVASLTVGAIAGKAVPHVFKYLRELCPGIKNVLAWEKTVLINTIKGTGNAVGKAAGKVKDTAVKVKDTAKSAIDRVLKIPKIRELKAARKVLDGLVEKVDLKVGSPFKFNGNGEVVYKGITFKNVPSLRHLTLDQLEDMIQYGKSPVNMKGEIYEIHHPGQICHTESGVVEVLLYSFHKQIEHMIDLGAGLSDKSRNISRYLKKCFWQDLARSERYIRDIIEGTRLL